MSFDLGTVGTVVVLLGACLFALLLVLMARREAGAVRARAEEDARSIDERARGTLLEIERREMRLADREASLAADQANLVELERAARTEADEADQARRKAERALDSAERAAARTVSDAERQVANRLADAREQALVELEEVAGLTRDQALDQLTARLVTEAEARAAARVRRAESQARRQAEARARRVVATAVQRIAGPSSAAVSMTTMPLPSEELKGRIIGKEGRNIRAFEALTGVNILVDEIPGAVALSSFDAERREVAVVALEALIADGRINPQRIEAAYADALATAAERTEAAGHDAAERAGVDGLTPEVIEVLGRLRLRTSSGQNVLEHLVECSHIAAALAVEIGADVETARRAAFLHDLGKGMAVDHGRSHAAAGAQLLREAGESPSVVNGVAAHHDEVPAESVEAVLVQVADAISASREGARRESVEQFTERMERLEHLVGTHDGVRRVLAMAAGREVRVVVEPTEVPDEALPGLAEAIARQIEEQSEVPGEIRVTVVRELRASATAG
ncbi:MAG: HDIG domain-containing protein [Micrococcales bacterium]|nr:HDIG domain-containing protein [Micrococcales bacterium]